MTHNVFVYGFYGRESVGFSDIANQMIKVNNLNWSRKGVRIIHVVGSSFVFSSFVLFKFLQNNVSTTS